jgi:hypothetical protein
MLVATSQASSDSAAAAASASCTDRSGRFAMTVSSSRTVALFLPKFLDEEFPRPIFYAG